MAYRKGFSSPLLSVPPTLSTPLAFWPVKTSLDTMSALTEPLVLLSTNKVSPCLSADSSRHLISSSIFSTPLGKLPWLNSLLLTLPKPAIFHLSSRPQSRPIPSQSLSHCIFDLALSLELAEPRLGHQICAQYSLVWCQSAIGLW